MAGRQHFELVPEILALELTKPLVNSNFKLTAQCTYSLHHYRENWQNKSWKQKLIYQSNNIDSYNSNVINGMNQAYYLLALWQLLETFWLLVSFHKVFNEGVHTFRLLLEKRQMFYDKMFSGEM